jgi:hypothetical protein
MFFVTLLLEEVLSWMRGQPGTSNLRMLLYFDEVFGYMPPHPANPPSKVPLLTLLKQARAFGVGVLLATQNPVDLDYKALSNAGTWFIGKLQTERDKARLLDGLETVTAEWGKTADRAELEKVIASLGNRVFLMNNIHQGKQTIFQVRHTLSFLRGPMTPAQIEQLMQPLKDGEAVHAAITLCMNCQKELPADAGQLCPHCGKNPFVSAASRAADREFRESLQLKTTRPLGADYTGEAANMAGSTKPPVLPPEVTQFFVPTMQQPGHGEQLEYAARLVGFGEATFVVDKRKGKEHTEHVRLLAEPTALGRPVEWEAAEPVSEWLAASPLPKALWGPVPESLDTGRKLKALEKAFVEHIYSNQKLSLFENGKLEMVSEPGEKEADFRKRCREAALAEAKKALEVEKAKFQPKFEALDAELPEPKKGDPDAPPPPPPQPQPAKSSGWFSGLFGGGGSEPAAPPRKKGPAPGSKQEEKVRKLAADYEAKRAEIKLKWKQAGEDVEAIQVKPRKADVRVTHFGLAWVPYALKTKAGGKVERVALHR